MTFREAEKYFEQLSDSKKQRFNLLVTIGGKLGKPAEGAYEYARTIMEQEKLNG